ncbi:MAG: trypsin-like peptidase domain-containing protein [Armatimonadota bacterium]|jgi:serine protease Do
MKLGRIVSYVLVFVLGFAACALIIYKLGYTSGTTSAGAVSSNLGARPFTPLVRKGQNPIADAAEAVGPAVVNIDTVTEQRVANPFEGFFGGLPGMPQRQLTMGKGSGVIISRDGYILTNNHVVAGAQRISVRLKDGRKFHNVRLVGSDSRTDLAVLKLASNNLPFARLGNSDAIRVGDWAIALGNPLGLENTVTVGVISATKRNEQAGMGTHLENLIQTDAAINPGNSGGALANIAGEVIGINTMIASTDQGPQKGNIGIGFAIPINSARGIVKELIAKGKIVRPFLGVGLGDITGDLADWYKERGYSAAKGAVIMQVYSGSPAAAAGLKQGDIITEIDGAKVTGSQQAVKIIAGRKVGQVVRLSVWRMDKTLLIGVKLAEMPRSPAG